MEDNKQIIDSLNYKDVASIMKIVAHPARLKILFFLLDTHHPCVEDISNHIQISQSQTSQFLALMRKKKIVGVEKYKNYVYYYVSDDDIKELLETIRSLF